MGGGGVPNGGVTIVEISEQRSLKPTGKPNSRTDLYVNGKRKQSRWYDHNGKAIRNRDYFHQDGDQHILFLMIIHGIGVKDLRDVQTGYCLITKIIRRRING